MSAKQPHLTPKQVLSLNYKHGWFQHGDAQGHVSRAFAQDAIDAHERLRAAAPDLLAALHVFLRDYTAVHDIGDLEMQPAIYQARAAIAKATGKAP
jgi:hypothetical protein